MSLLYALARGHALVHGRRQLTADDLPIVARAVLESTPNDRRAVMRILLAKDGLATTGDVEQALRCSAPTARAILETLDKLGVGEFVNPGPPNLSKLILAEPLHWILSDPAAQSLEKKTTPCREPHGQTDVAHGREGRAKDEKGDEEAILRKVVDLVDEGVLLPRKEPELDLATTPLDVIRRAYEEAE
jgi:hypothetical protein